MGERPGNEPVDGAGTFESTTMSDDDKTGGGKPGAGGPRKGPPRNGGRSAGAGKGPGGGRPASGGARGDKPRQGARPAGAGDGAKRSYADKPRKPYAGKRDGAGGDAPTSGGEGRPSRARAEGGKPFTPKSRGMFSHGGSADGRPAKPRSYGSRSHDAAAGEGAGGEAKPRPVNAERRFDRTAEPRGKDGAKASDRGGFRKERPARAQRPDGTERSPRFEGKRPRRETVDADAVPEAVNEASLTMRIARRLARAGVASRRDAEAMITEGRVSVNGKVLDTPALDVGPKDRITIDGEPLPVIERTRLWLFHKPSGLVTTNKDPEGRPTVFEKLPAEMPRVLTIGRLDITTEGLLLLTNDGGLARVLELPATGWLRRYRVRAHGTIDQAKLDELREGIAIDGVFYGAIEATLDREQGSNVWLTLGLREGKNREVKRVLGHLGLDVNRLIRLSYGPFQLADLTEGAVREIHGKTLARPARRPSDRGIRRRFRRADHQRILQQAGRGGKKRLGQGRRGEKAALRDRAQQEAPARGRSRGCARPSRHAFRSASPWLEPERPNVRNAQHGPSAATGPAVAAGRSARNVGQSPPATGRSGPAALHDDAADPRPRGRTSERGSDRGGERGSDRGSDRGPSRFGGDKPARASSGEKKFGDKKFGEKSFGGDKKFGGAGGKSSDDKPGAKPLTTGRRLSNVWIAPGGRPMGPKKAANEEAKAGRPDKRALDPTQRMGQRPGPRSGPKRDGSKPTGGPAHRRRASSGRLRRPETAEEGLTRHAHRRRRVSRPQACRAEERPHSPDHRSQPRDPLQHPRPSPGCGSRRRARPRSLFRYRGARPRGPVARRPLLPLRRGGRRSPRPDPLQHGSFRPERPGEDLPPRRGEAGRAGTMEPFDMVFADPPYGKGLGEAALVSPAKVAG